jgi:membrane-associated protease RseP (regulator of RpoE activity)
VTQHHSSSPIDPGGSPAGVFLRPPPPAPRYWLHGLLFLATLASSTFCGGLYYGWLPSPELLERVRDPLLLTEGLKFSLPLMAILLAHEMGHFVAARRHGLEVTLPFFLPMPIPLLFSPGTLGAIIRVKSPIRTRRQLLDIGAWGPIAGFITLLPFLVAGTAMSGVQAIDPEGAGVYFGEPLLFRALARGVFFPGLAAGEDILVHPTAWAAWFGLFVTALNLLPFFQLDGGHVWYALFGRRHRQAAWPLLGVLAALGLLWPGWWLWAVVIAILGPRHPPVLDEDRPLDRRRVWLGWCALLIFAVSFTPRPIWIGPG